MKSQLKNPMIQIYSTARRHFMTPLRFIIGVICLALFASGWMVRAESAESPELSGVGAPNAKTSLLSYPLASFSQSVPNAESTTLQTANLRKLILSGSHYQDSELKLEIGLHQISVDLNNTRTNGISAKLRQQDANAIAAIVERAIKSDHQFSDVNAIHINYLKTTEGKSLVLKGFDFYQTAAGNFVINRS